MRVTTELSGLGHYGVCSKIPWNFLEPISEILVKKVDKLGDKFKWDNPEFDRPFLFGFERSLSILNQNDEADPLATIIWSPQRLGLALESVSYLLKIARALDLPQRDDGSDLEIEGGQSSGDGWFVRANFSPVIWDVIESCEFKSLLPAINTDIRCWWEEASTFPRSEQYASLFNGNDGLNLQVMQLGGHGLWIVGSRKARLGYQFCDHNTDCAFHAMSHVQALCIILKHCRTASVLG